jgi:GntR family transcriptional regulator
MAGGSIYRTIADDLRELITSGQIQPGGYLPSERELEKRYDVTRVTVRAATSLLVHEGLIQRVPGRSGGMMVRDTVVLTYHASRAELPTGLYSESDTYFGEVEEQGYEPSQSFSLAIERLSDEMAARLHVEAGTTAAVRRCLRRVNGKPTSTQDGYYPQWLTQDVPELLSPDDIKIGTTRLLAERGFQQVAYRDELMARMPTPEHVRMLGLARGVPVLYYIRTGVTAEKRPVRVTVSLFAGDRNRVVYTLGDASVLDVLEGHTP